MESMKAVEARAAKLEIVVFIKEKGKYTFYCYTGYSFWQGAVGHLG